MIINNKIQSPNLKKRTNPIEYIILHFTEMSFDDALSKLCDKDSNVSAHYLIKETGEIFQLVQEENIAWHAGKSFWCGKDKLNQNSVGIELDNLGNKNFDQRQMDSCITLCKKLVKKYNLPKENIIGHSDIAPDRKIDPGIFFDWEFLYKNNLGVWHDLVFSNDVQPLYEYGHVSDKIKIIQTKLKNIGYKIQESGVFDQQTNYVVRSFQAKFQPSLLKKMGLKFYNDLNSKYIWDKNSDSILNKIHDLICS